MKAIYIILVILAALVLVGWIGLQVKPKDFDIAFAQGEVKTIALPENLPGPVERFYSTVYGSQAPVIETAIIHGTGRIRRFGIWMPARYVMVHNAGRDYRHYFEATWFGIPVLKINEGYIDGKSFFESPMGNFYDDPNSNQGANLALWAEGAWFPSLWVTDARAYWQAVDENTAILYVPFEEGEESFVVRFDPQTGLVDGMEVMRFKAPEDQNKVLWFTNQVTKPDGSTVFCATWQDEGSAWLELSVKEMIFNADVSEYIRARGK